MARYLVVYEKSGNGYGAFSTDLVGCYATGKTLEEVRTTMRSAMAFHIDSLKLGGMDVPEGRADHEIDASVEVVDVP